MEIPQSKYLDSISCALTAHNNFSGGLTWKIENFDITSMEQKLRSPIYEDSSAELEWWLVIHHRDSDEDGNNIGIYLHLEKSGFPKVYATYSMSVSVLYSFGNSTTLQSHCNEKHCFEKCAGRGLLAFVKTGASEKKLDLLIECRFEMVNKPETLHIDRRRINQHHFRGNLIRNNSQGSTRRISFGYRKFRILVK